MLFTETALAGAFILDVELIHDSRGFFTRSFCRHEFEAHGLNAAVAQTNISFNVRKGTLRGLHFQFPPSAETKLVRCTRGAILDVIVDLRPESATYLQHVAVELTADNRRALYVPERFAHGYQTLDEGAEVSYQVGQFYAPADAAGLPHDDPGLGIAWPLPVTDISDKDRNWPPLDTVGSQLQRRLAVPQGVAR